MREGAYFQQSGDRNTEKISHERFSLCSQEFELLHRGAGRNTTKISPERFISACHKNSVNIADSFDVMLETGESLGVLFNLDCVLSESQRKAFEGYINLFFIPWLHRSVPDHTGVSAIVLTI